MTARHGRPWNHPPLDKRLELVEDSSERSTNGVTERWSRGFLVFGLTECTKARTFGHGPRWIAMLCVAVAGGWDLSPLLMRVQAEYVLNLFCVMCCFLPHVTTLRYRQRSSQHQLAADAPSACNTAQYCMQHFPIPLTHHKCITIPMFFACRACLLLYAILKWHALVEHSYAQFMLKVHCDVRKSYLHASVLPPFPLIQ